MAAARALSEQAQSQASLAGNEYLASSQTSATKTNVVDSIAAGTMNRPDSTSAFQPVNIDAPLNFAPPVPNTHRLSDTETQAEVKQDIKTNPTSPSQQTLSTTITPAQSQNTNVSHLPFDHIGSNEHDQTPPHAKNSENKMVSTTTSPPHAQAQNVQVQHKPPVFTAHGPIPFGNKTSIHSNTASNGNVQAVEKEKKEEDVWEVPDTPQPQR